MCVSQMLKNDIGNIFGRKDNVYVIPNATDAESDKKYEKKDISALYMSEKCIGRHYRIVCL